MYFTHSKELFFAIILDELESFTTWVLRAPTWVAAIYNLSGCDLQVGFVCVIYIQFKGDNGKKQKSSFVNGML